MHGAREPNDDARVLVADDDPLLRQLAAEAIHAEGLVAVEAADGDEALRLAEELPPRLVLLDVRMPGRDGFSVLAAMREHPALRDVPVLVMTGCDDHESIERAFRAGATDFIVKPIQWTILRHRVRYMIRASEQLRKLQRSERALAAAHRIAQLGTWSLDFEGRFQGSAEIHRVFCVDPERAGGSLLDAIAERVHPDDRPLVASCLGGAVRSPRPFTTDYRLALPDGSTRFVHMEARAVRGDDGEVRGLEGIFQDVTARKRAEEEARFLAYHDSLTGLANRRLLGRMLERNIERATPDREIALLCIDIDNFKQVNDSLGHPAGDRVLRVVGERLTHSLRPMDPIARSRSDGGSVARNGGDEFTVVLADIRDPGDAERVAQRILEQVEQPIRVADTDLRIGASIGIAIFPRDAASGEELMRNADAALYHAKRAGRRRYHFYDVEMNRAARRRMEIRNRLGPAIDDEALELHFQPRVDPTSRGILGMEALARWKDAELGQVEPAEFIPAAEDSLLLTRFSAWSLACACRQIGRWRAEGFSAGTMSVNVSPQLFRDGKAAELVEKALAETGVDPACLEIEITENALLEDTEAAARQLRRLRRQGVRVAIDDFGTGYSSLRYLTRLELDTLKIDRSLIDRLGSDRQSDLIVEALISMCRALGLRVVAEGVEEERQLEVLRRLGCDEVQGFLISRAVPGPELERMLCP